MTVVNGYACRAKKISLHLIKNNVDTFQGFKTHTKYSSVALH